MRSAAAMSELWRPSTAGRMVSLLLRASAGCGRPAALLRTPILRSRSAPSPRLSPPWHSHRPWSPDGCRSTHPSAGLLPAGGALPSRNSVDITVEQLARHTSGLPRSPQGPSLRAVWAAGTRGEDPYAPISTPVLLKELSRTRLRRTPGQPRIRYSNFGAGLLGLALTNAYDKVTYQEMIEEVVLRPLGLVATTSGGETQAAGHAFRRRPAPNWHLDGPAGAGALRSTARDLLSYLRGAGT
jgi:hypothetical protein